MRQPDAGQDIKKSISNYNTMLIVIGVAVALVIFLSIQLSFRLNYYYIYMIFLVVPLMFISIWVFRQRNILRHFARIRSDWGAPGITQKKRIFDNIRMLHDNIRSEDENNDIIDDRTWNDLNMDLLYARIDRTFTDPGQAILYRMLHRPLFQRDVLKERSSFIGLLQNNSALREEIQFRLSCLGRQNITDDLFFLLWGNTFPKSRFRPLFPILAVLPVVSLIVALVTGIATLYLIPILAFITNLIIHYLSKRRYKNQIEAFPYLLGCIRTIKHLASIKHEGMLHYANRLEELFNASKVILRRTRFYRSEKNTSVSFEENFTSAVFEYLNILFLLEVRAFYSVINEVEYSVGQLREMYMILGEFDALQSIASYRESLDYFIEPDFVEEGIYLEFEDAIHPLLNDPVPASFKISQNGTIITGSNMSGKSTFLRNIGTNTLMAQTIVTCLASSYRASFFRIVTSISQTDNIIEGKSFYYVEAERILHAIRSIGEGVPTLCIIDELLSGTNSIERISASEAIIQYLIKQNALVIIATHDLELVSRLDGDTELYHFTDEVDENGLKFDYSLKPGIATTQNAVTLLKYLGYPDQIVKKAEQT